MNSDSNMKGLLYSIPAAIVIFLLILFPSLTAFLISIWWLLPALTLIVCAYLWLSYSYNPKPDTTIAPEYGPPENISPVQMGMLINNGDLKIEHLIASLMDLSVKNYINIEPIDKKPGFSDNDFVLILLSEDWTKLPTDQKNMLDNIFLMPKKGQVARLSSTKNTLSVFKKMTEDNVFNEFILDGYFYSFGRTLQNIMISVAIIFFSASLYSLYASTAFDSVQAGSLKDAMATVILFACGLFISSLILSFFAHFMNQLTPKGIDTIQRIKGLKLYIETAEKERHKFGESEGRYDKLMPYAMVLGIIDVWTKKVQSIQQNRGLFDYFVPSDHESSSFGMTSFVSNELSIFESILTKK